MEFSHYSAVPASVGEEVVAKVSLASQSEEAPAGLLQLSGGCQGHGEEEV
jgi:hypothetical protein